MHVKFITLFSLGLAAIAFAQGNRSIQRIITTPAFDETPEKITQLCQAERDLLIQKLDQIGRGKTPTFTSTTLAIEKAITEFTTHTGALQFYFYVSPDPKVRDAAEACQTENSKLMVDVGAREDLYRVSKAFDNLLKAGKAPKFSDYQQAKLHSEAMIGFRRNGMELPLKERTEFIQKQKEIVELSTQFEKAIMDDQQVVETTLDKLGGLSTEFTSKLKKDEKTGKVSIPVNESTYAVVAQNAEDEGLRKDMDFKYAVRGGVANVDRLKRAVRLRYESSRLLGYKNFADYQTEQSMAKTGQNVLDFLKPLAVALRPKGEENLNELLKMKRALTKNPTASEVNFWEWRYYENQLRKAQGVDNEKVKEYFPVDVVIPGMFDIYQTLLSVKFEEAPDIKVWHKSVKAYRIKQNGQVFAVFYMDLFPRQGKYTHAAAFDFIPGYQLSPGKYHAPSAAIVANFNEPAPGVASLLSHGEVVTLFHEFGHIMHQTLTTARYASLSGSSVRRDFVEAPSQMLENWVWKAEGLRRLSGHYSDHKKKLPADLIDKLISAKNVNLGMIYLRQLSFGYMDMQLHVSDGSLDPDAVFNEAVKTIQLIPMQAGTHGVASFGHLMGGYAAGYYGYLYSKVFAEDMFSARFDGHLLDPKVGADYRKKILELGGTKEPMDLVESFIGRKPNQKAFLKSIGL